ncbi:putative ATP-dependent helicase [Spatholobus suberectus]|nr:putative ATP-dependent helicase [Spatholobus suberectus]
MMADEGFEYPYLLDGDGDAADDDKLCIDLDTIMSVLDEDTNPSESSPEDSSLKNISPGESGIHDNFLLQNGNSVLECEHENRGPSSQTFSSPNAHAGGYTDSFSVIESDEICFTERTGVSNCEIPAYFADTRFPDPEANSSNIAVCRDNLNLTLWKCENDSQIKHAGYDAESEHASHGSIIENVDVNFENYGAYMKDIIGVSGKQENDSCTSFEMSFVDADRSSHVATSTDSSICQGSNVPNDFSDYYLSLNCYQGMDDRPVVANTSGCLSNGVYPHTWQNEEMTRNMKVAKMKFFADTAHVSSGMDSSANGGISFQDSQFVFADSKHASFFPGNVLFEDNASAAAFNLCFIYFK